MKQTSMLSALVAVRSPRRATWARTSAFVISPTGSTVLASWSHPRTTSTYGLVPGHVRHHAGAGRAVGGGGATGVVAGRHRVEAHRPGPLVEPAPLDAAVALDARVRRPPRRVALDVRLHDHRVELLGEVEHVVREVELRGDAARVLDVGHRAAPGVAGAAPELEGDAGDVVALGAGARRRPTSRHHRSSRRGPSRRPPDHTTPAPEPRHRVRDQQEGTVDVGIGRRVPRD